MSTNTNQNLEYHEELPADKGQIWGASLESYGNIPSSQIETHLRNVLAVDGAPAANLICTKDFSIWDMNSFESMERFEACFIAGDLSNPDTVLSGIAGKVDIVHAAAIFHLCVWDDQVKVGVQFSVLFRPDANATVVDRQIADLEPLDPVDQAIQDLCWYRHNMRTWQQLK
ncbi:hypothetical protein PENANT_c005G08488 [Penicillium antarcticum]|uniref:Uncharacterized protein n=1 Tax=Penicillium antarcticum TaxID=416450 RepID=A0A1V6QFR1_9EURO|nr:hypothetical protein PENANT_c005G08488 [Penicillium antarcticum]